MELRHIRYFLAVAEEMNFTRAAEKLCIAQPPLSRQIQELEEELEAELFIRKPHALSLTKEGEMFRQYAVQVMNLVQKSSDDIREMKNGLRGTVYLATVEGHAPELFAGWIAEFQKEYPQVCYNIWNGNSDDVLNRLKMGLCDLAILTEPCGAEGIHTLPVYEEPWVAMLPVDHPLAKAPGNIVQLQDLADCDLIIPSRESRLQEINSWFAAAGKKPVIRCRIANVQNACQLTSRGVGIALHPASVNMKADLPVCIKEIGEPFLKAQYVLIWDEKRQLSKASEKFLELVRTSLEKKI